jgi:hypothetical protein
VGLVMIYIFVCNRLKVGIDFDMYVMCGRIDGRSGGTCMHSVLRMIACKSSLSISLSLQA